VPEPLPHGPQIHTGQAAWIYGTMLPLLQHPTSSSRLEFFFSHMFAFSFNPAFAGGLGNARFKHKAAEFVWIVPTVILICKFLTFPASSVFQRQFSAALHQYFGGGFLIPGARDWHEFFSMAGSSYDMGRGMAQYQFTAPFYAGVGYSVAAWIGRRTELGGKVAVRVKQWEQSRFGHQP
jgi:hypothetical protein